MTATVTPETPAHEAAPIPAAASPADSQVLGIIALVSAACGILAGLAFPLSIVAIVLGALALSREPRSRTLAIWSIVLGVVPFAIGLMAVVVGAAIAIPLGIWGLLGAL